MVVTGPNGSGKSTLLIAIKRQKQNTRPIYQGPHRAIRRQTIRNRWLGQSLFLSDALSQDQVSRLEGITLYDQQRDPWNADETGNLIKYSLCNIATEVNTRIAQKYHEEGQISRGEIPDVWEPLKSLISSLLPHLSFEGIDTAQRDNMRVLFKNRKSGVEIDFDDLSSGEKSIIQLFLPLIEDKVRRRLSEFSKSYPSVPKTPRPVIIDEPELHLHPNLQELLLAYMREMAATGLYQFIISSHSQNLVEAANAEELFLLKPVNQVAEGENQLIRIADNDQKLDLITEIFGHSTNLTSLKNVLIVEGKSIGKGTQSSSDKKIYTLLDPRFKSLTIIPSNSKSECISRAKHVNSVLDTFSPSQRAIALVDSDVEDESKDHVISLPVSMVENFLVDPEIIFRATELIREKIELQSVHDVENALASILDSMEAHEVERRVKANLGYEVFRLSGPLSLAPATIDEHIAAIRENYSEASIKKLESAARKEVDGIKTKQQRRERYDGKRIIDSFVRDHLGASGLSKEIFKYSCAREASKRKSVKSFCDTLFAQI
ncbi:MAG: AAA family ATPase [Parasphingopyxis sp.]|uniref:AAA family ATPase n=1 Tax=Parasphingopyxis sp. TaxID=1920299 RepID=UPI003FA0F1CC